MKRFYLLFFTIVTISCGSQKESKSERPAETIETNSELGSRSTSAIEDTSELSDEKKEKINNLLKKMSRDNITKDDYDKWDAEIKSLVAGLPKDNSALKLNIYSICTQPGEFVDYKNHYFVTCAKWHHYTYWGKNFRTGRYENITKSDKRQTRTVWFDR